MNASSLVTHVLSFFGFVITIYITNQITQKRIHFLFIFFPNLWWIGHYFMLTSTSFSPLTYRQQKLRHSWSMQKRGVYWGVEGVMLFLVWWGTYEPGCRLSALVKEVRGCLIVWLLQPWGGEEGEGWVGGTWQDHMAKDKTEWDQYDWKLSLKHYLLTETLKHIWHFI